MSSDTPCSERQVTLYEATCEDSIPGTVEDMKISIVNDLVTGLKRQREEEEEKKPVTSSSKRLCSAVFICSTPHSSSPPPWSSPSTSKSKSIRPSHVSTPSRTLEQNSEFSNEWDDSLLEPSDDEDDSPLYLTVDEIESLLEDDSCFTADPYGLKECSSPCNVARESEDEKKEVCSSPCSLRETQFCEEDLNNYAAIATSPSPTVPHSVDVQLSKQESIVADNVVSSDSVEESKELPSSALLTLDNKEALPNQLSCNSSAHLPMQSPTSLYTVDVVVEWNNDPELHFDGDIDNLLAISPGGETSCEECEEETAAEPYIQCTEHITSAVSDSTSTFQQSNAVPGNQTANSAGSDTVDAVQQLSPSIFHQPDALKTPHPTSSKPDLPKDSGSPLISTVVISEIQSNTDAAEDVTPNVSTENDAQSPAGLNDQPLNSSSAQTSNSQHTTTALVTNSSAPQRSRVIVPQMPRLTNRSILSSIELEHDKDYYCNQVVMHIDGPEGANLDDPLSELVSLLNQISRENPNWQHPSNFSRRNHPRRGRRPSKRYTLKEWVNKNGGGTQRFLDIPSQFQRNPIPELPHF